MADKIIENNQVSMMGKIAAGFTFSHQVFGEGFYMTELLVKRLSDSEDRIPVIASFSGCLSMFLNPENRTETMRPINNNIPMIPVPVAS